jgi:tryptophanyl-tRNA synthetase
MSKSQGNAINLSATSSEIKAAVHRMYTDPGHVRVSDPGRVEGNVVFTYLDAFDEDHEMVADLKMQYRRGGLGDVVIKKRLERVLESVVDPIRERRAVLAHQPDYVLEVLYAGTANARAITERTLSQIRAGLGLFTF